MIDELGTVLPLVPIRFGDREFSEDSLQAAIHACPALLPIEEIDPSHSPVVSLGRESDNSDYLLISPSGRLTIVKTKLWRNSESTRQAVAQILHYAARMSKWSYEELESNARHAMAPEGLQPPVPLISPAGLPGTARVSLSVHDVAVIVPEKRRGRAVWLQEDAFGWQSA